MGTWQKQKRLDLTPSSADRWMTCTESPNFIFQNFDRLPPQDRKFSDPGNSAHEVAAALLQGRKINLADCPAPVAAEMRWHGFNYADFVESQVEPGGKLIVEQRLPLFYANGRNAVVDAAAINPNNLHVIDYKYGEGIIVSPVENLQCTIYGHSVPWNWAKLFAFDVGEHVFTKPNSFPIFITIYQPRTRDGEPYHTWETNWGEIRERARAIHETAKRIIEAHKTGETLEFKPSEKACQWCPVNKPGPDGNLLCKARQDYLLKDLGMLTVIDDAPKPTANVLNESQLAAIVKHGDQIKKWIDDAQDFALQHMRNGGKIPGFKLVTSRGGNRFWSNPKQAAKFLEADTILRKEEIFSEPKLIGPAAVEKLLGKGKFPTRVYNLISKPPGQPVIAPEDDPRESALIDGAKEFWDLDGGTIRTTNLNDF